MNHYKNAPSPSNKSDGLADDDKLNIVAGRNAVLELLRSSRSVDKIFVKQKELEGSMLVIGAEAKKRGVPIICADKGKLDELAGGVIHQGVVAQAAAKEYVSVEKLLDIAKERGEKPFIVIADGICDPHNLGAIIRSCEAAGVHGVIIPKRRSSGLTSTTMKASAGAIEHMAIAKVTNLASTIEFLKENGLWIVACEAGGQTYDSIDLTIPVALIMGSEESGVSDILKKNSDFTASIPMFGKVNSLNVSCACSVILYQAVKMRKKK